MVFLALRVSSANTDLVSGATESLMASLSAFFSSVANSLLLLLLQRGFFIVNMCCPSPGAAHLLLARTAMRHLVLRMLCISLGACRAVFCWVVRVINGISVNITAIHFVVVKRLTEGS